MTEIIKRILGIILWVPTLILSLVLAVTIELPYSIINYLQAEKSSYEISDYTGIPFYIVRGWLWTDFSAIFFTTLLTSLIYFIIFLKYFNLI